MSWNKLIAIVAIIAWQATLRAQAPPPAPAPIPLTQSSLSPGTPAPKVTDVWVVFKTHFDIGYTDRVPHVLRRYREEFMDKALKIIEANQALPPRKRFVWTVPGWPLKHILGPLQTPERRARIEKAIREHALTVHAAPFTLHTESLDLEDLARGLHYSAHIAREYGLPLPRSAKMTDVPEHGWVLPTVLARGGIEFIQIGCNSACQYPRVPRLFWWEGPDGSRVLCNYTPDYGSGILPPPGWPSKNYLAMIMNGDNHGPPSDAEVENIRKQAARQLPGVRLHFGKLDDFVDAVKAERPNLDVVRRETPDTWIHGVMSMPAATKIARDIRPLEPALDSLDTHLKLAGLPTPPLGDALAEAYENSLLYGEHTWGMNGAFGGRGIWPLSEWKKKLPAEQQQKFLQSFEDHCDYIRKTQSIVNDGIRSRLELLAKNVNVPGKRTVVWNALPWPRSGMVNGIHVENVPANGYQTISNAAPQPPTGTHSNASLETPFYRVTFNLQRGGIASLIEKRTGREWVDQSSPYVLGQFLHERFSKREVDRFFRDYSRMAGGWAFDDLGKPGMPGAAARRLENPLATVPGEPNPGAMGKPGLPGTEYLAVSPGTWSIATTGNVTTLNAGDTKNLAKGCLIKFTFDEHTPAVDCEWIVTDKTPDKTPEGGWLCFPFAVEKPRFTVGRPGAPIDPATDIISGANRHLMAVATGVSITGNKKMGVSVCPLDSPLVSLGKPGLWWWSMDYAPSVPTVFVNLFNNMWNTNFPLWQEGSWSERVRFWPTTDLVVPAWEARVPLLAGEADGPAGTLPRTQSGLSVSRPGVLVTAFGYNPDGIGTLLRVWDQTGESKELTVTIPGKFKTATPVNLRGEKTGEPRAIHGNKLTFNIGAYAPASFNLK